MHDVDRGWPLKHIVGLTVLGYKNRVHKVATGLLISEM